MPFPTPVLLLSASASLCWLSVLVFPSVLPDTKFSTLFLGVTSLVFGAWSFWCVFIYPRWQSPLRYLPQAKGAIPLIGHPKATLRRSPGDLFLRFMNEVPNEGLIRVPGPLNSDWLLLTNPTSLAEVLVTKAYDFEKEGQVRQFLRKILGDGLIIVEGDEHKFQRKHTSPAFSFRHIKELYPVFWNKAVELVNCVSAEVYANAEPMVSNGKAEGIVEINHWANKVTMDIIGVAGLGREFNTLHNSDDKLISNYEQILEPTTEKAIFFGLNMLLPLRVVAALPWKLNQTLKDVMFELREHCRQLVRDKKEMLRSEKEDTTKDILSLLIKSNNFGDEMLVDQLLTFLAAGHETTSSAFTWGTYLLATHPEIQTQLRAEVRANLPSPSTPLDPNFDLSTVLENLPLLTAVCNETLRLYPPVPTSSRISNKATSINNTPVPAGTRIFFSPWATNRCSKLWGPTATQFIPARWIDPLTGKANNHGGAGVAGEKSNYNLLTFLHGPRSCIGEKFAKSELKALIAVFVGSFEMKMGRVGEVPVPAGAITTKPRDGMSLRLGRVDGW